MRNFVSYYSKTDIALYNKIQKKFGSVDAKGGVAKKVNRNKVLGPSQFLFCVVTYIGVYNFFFELQTKTFAWYNFDFLYRGHNRPRCPMLNINSRLRHNLLLVQQPNTEWF